MKSETVLWFSVQGGYHHTWVIGRGSTKFDPPHELLDIVHGIRTVNTLGVSSVYLRRGFCILKLPIRIHHFSKIDEMFVTCCILHNT